MNYDLNEFSDFERSTLMYFHIHPDGVDMDIRKLKPKYHACIFDLINRGFITLKPLSEENAHFQLTHTGEEVVKQHRENL